MARRRERELSSYKRRNADESEIQSRFDFVSSIMYHILSTGELIVSWCLYNAVATDHKVKVVGSHNT